MRIPGRDELAEFAKFLYECGDYEGARDMLDHFLAINFPDGVSDTSADADGRGFRALWGKFASEILLKNWDAAMADLLTLRSAIDERGFPPLQALQQRSWLCHWSLFVFFNHAKGHDGIMRELPGGYGKGNAPMYNWVMENMAIDKKSDTNTRGVKPYPYGNYSL